MPPVVPDSYIRGMNYVPTNGADPGDPAASTNNAKQTVIDGTPARVASIGLLALAVLVGLRWSGFKFNVTAGN